MMKSEKEALVLDVRKKIYSLINEFPGIYFRELQRQIGIATGNLMYHISFLQKHNLVKIETHQKKKRIFPIGLHEGERVALGMLRQRPVRHIVLLLLKYNQATNKSISKELHFLPSVTSYYLGRMERAGILVSQVRGRERICTLKNSREIQKVLIAFKASFLDKLVDNFAAAWEE